MRAAKTSQIRGAVSIVEALVVISILGILIGLLLPAVQRSRETASRAKCLNNLRQMGIALHNAHDAHGRLPPFQVTRLGSGEPDTILSWQALILPYLEQEPLWRVSIRACELDGNPTHNPPHVGYTTVISGYLCPSDSRLSTAKVTPSGDRCSFTSYIGVGGAYVEIAKKLTPLSGAFGGSPGARFADFADGLSNTLLVGERPPPDSLQAGRWYSGHIVLEPFGGPDSILPVNKFVSSPFDLACANARPRFFFGKTSNPCDRFHFWSLHPGGANFVFADGSARFLPYSAESVLAALATRAGGEVASFD